MEAWANKLKAMTDAGAVLIFDNEIWPHPKWDISKYGVSFTSGNCTNELWNESDDPAETYESLRGRIRVLVDAELPANS
jgi:hypothetical protein